MEEQKEHKRRVRYKGTHPRNYNEKYKELNPEKYQGTIEHVIQKGSTPAGMHIPILVDEILDFLKIEPGQNGLDASIRRPQLPYACMPAGKRASLCAGCRSDRDGKNKRTTGRAGVRP